ncbi:MAG TPA: ChaN family lipoprotein [Ramlibacter sp.]|nr:ChaN family lipoprotein [Ramlibacter sp.]
MIGFALGGCANAPPGLAAAGDPDILLLGEQHDAARHQRWHFEAVRTLAARGRLAALALEMAEEGRSTAGLPANADEAAVRAALGWNEKAWPWAPYAPPVMAAVRAGVPVLGANLPRARMRAAMADVTLDALLPPEALARQQGAVRNGHCGLLPESQIAPMTRIQLARDRAMAQTLAAAARPGASVVLLAGSGHVDEAVGVPRHLPGGLSAKALSWPAEPANKDYCADLRK